MSVDYLLHESAVGYAIFRTVLLPDTVGARLKEVQDSVQVLEKFGKMVQLVSFAPFQGAAQALQNANEVSEGIASEFLLSLLEINLPKSGKKNKSTLGVADKNLAGAIKGAFPGLDCETGETSEIVSEMLRGIRQHAHKLLKQLQEGDVERANLGLGVRLPIYHLRLLELDADGVTILKHAYSRARVKFSVQKNDNHIIQAIATLDNLDKAINLFSMRVREWYSWHFPELIRIVSDNYTYAKLALFIGSKERLSDKDLHELSAQVNEDSELAQSIIDVAKVSMGQALSDEDMENVTTFASKVVDLANYRKTLHSYLVSKMGIVAPNLGVLIGEMVGARLISHAGSLTNLSKYPASTVQILGAEKALFRALKTKGNTPKYGLIYHASAIGRAAQKNKGRISRFLANKCSIASRIDNFSEAPTTRFGEALKAQVEERLKFYDSGAAPTKNEKAMRNAMDSVLADINVEDPTANVDSDEEMADVAPRAVQKQDAQKKEKQKKKKDKTESREGKGKEGERKKKRKYGEVNGEGERKKEKKLKT